MKRADLQHLIASKNKKGPYLEGNLLGGSPMGIKAIYDVAKCGGSIGTHKLIDQDGNLAVVPKGAIVKFALFDEVTALDSANDTGRFALHIQSANDLVSATVISSLTGTVALAPLNTAATAIKMTDERNITATIDQEVITAGKFNVFVEYVFSD